MAAVVIGGQSTRPLPSLARLHWLVALAGEEFAAEVVAGSVEVLEGALGHPSLVPVPRAQGLGTAHGSEQGQETGPLGARLASGRIEDRACARRAAGVPPVEAAAQATTLA